MNHSLKVGFSFGLTSGIITTLGVIVGLNSSTHSKLVIIAGVLTIAIADSLSDALGIHISEETENKHTPKEIWQSTIATFLTKFIFASTFLIPLFFLQLQTAIVVSLIWGLSLLGIFSYYIAKKEREKPWKVVTEHLVIAALVIILTNYAGKFIATALGT